MYSTVSDYLDQYDLVKVIEPKLLVEKLSQRDLDQICLSDDDL